MDPNRYMEQRQKTAAPKPQPVQQSIPVQRVNTVQSDVRQQTARPAQPAKPVNRVQSAKPESAAASATGRVYRTQPLKPVQTGKMQISGKRFFGQILIDRWVIRVNGEQHEMSFGSKGTKTLELPAGVYLVTAYTPYLGMRCMRVSADVEIKPGKTAHLSYQTVFDIFKEGVLLSGDTRIS
ncbi:MAG: hypothetical protein IJY74_06015 [Oscillospiraceae bacterium]|nr:hypothetical protein [Oscillospiraceae bacterium]